VIDCFNDGESNNANNSGSSGQHEVIEQIASLQAILSLLQSHHPHRRILCKTLPIVSWINQKKDAKRETIFCTDLWKQKIRLLSSLLSTDSTLDEVPLRDWTDRMTESAQLFGLGVGAQLGEAFLGPETTTTTIVEKVRQMVVSEEDPVDSLMTNVAKVKDLFQRIRASTTKDQQLNAVSELAQVLLDSFDGEQIMSFLFGELSKPVNNDHLITEALFKILQVKSKANSLRPLVINWTIMCLDNFVQIGDKHVLLCLSCLFLIIGSKQYPINTVLLNDLYYGSLEEKLVQDIFFISGSQFLLSEDLPAEGKNTLLTSLKKLNSEPFVSLASEYEARMSK